MIAYKAFNKDLSCMGYRFKMGLNITEKAKARAYGFHCAENPLDCLTYYGNMNAADYYIVNAGGDVNEDGNDTKISCTELTIIKKLSKEDFVLHAMAYMVDHPKREWNRYVSKEKGAENHHGFAIVRGVNPIAKGGKGSILALAKENESGEIVEIAMTVVDGTKVKPNIWYALDLSERRVAE